MDIKTYEKITAFCTKWLVKAHHDRHLEDLIQHVAMEHFATDGKKSWEFACCDYSRSNGLNANERSKQSARTIELSLSIDMPSKDGESDDSSYLLDQESISRSTQDDELLHEEDNLRGALEEFLAPLKLHKEALLWAMKSYRVKTNLK